VKYQKLITHMLWIVISFMLTAQAQEQDFQPTVATFNIVNNTDGALYYEPYGEPYITCGKVIDSDDFPIQKGATGTLAIQVDDPSCFDVLTSFVSSTIEPSDTVIAPPEHVFFIDYYSTWDVAFEIFSIDGGMGLYQADIIDPEWDMTEDKTFTIETENLTKQYLKQSKSTGTVTIKNTTNYTINITFKLKYDNDGSEGLFQFNNNQYLIPEKSSAKVKIRTSANGSALGDIELLLLDDLMPASLITIPVDVGPDYGTATDEAFAADVMAIDEDINIEATFNKTTWDGKRNKKFKLTVKEVN